MNLEWCGGQLLLTMSLLNVLLKRMVGSIAIRIQIKIGKSIENNNLLKECGDNNGSILTIMFLKICIRIILMPRESLINKERS